MEVILLKKIAKLGDFGDIVNVKNGFARNYLIPKGLAILANKTNREHFAEQRAALESELAGELAGAKQRAEKIQQLEAISLSVRAGETGKLFGSVGTRDIAALLQKAGVEVRRDEIHLPHGVLRATGEYDVQIHLHADVTTQVKLHLNPEKA